MPGNIIDGKAAAEDLKRKVAEYTARLAVGRRPGLAVVIVGEDPASQAYVRSKTKACEAAGFRPFNHTLPEDTSEVELIMLIDRLNAHDHVDGILVQLPLPRGIDTKRVVSRINPEKDVDGLHPLNLGRLAVGEEGLRPCTPSGCMMLARSVTELGGKNVVVIGRSILVGKPIALMMTQADATVTLAHSRSQDVDLLCRDADVVVAAVGKPGMVKGNWIRKGAVVIDVGINRVDGKLVGDVAFHEAVERAGHITPVPGGVGPMTVACLMANTLKAYCRRNEIILADLEV